MIERTSHPDLSVQWWPDGPGPEADALVLQWVVRGNDSARAVEVAQISTREGGMWTCSRCSARWQGLKTAHCDAYRETFTVVAALDKHRARSHTHGTCHCLDPAAVGLVYAGRAYRCWGFAGRGEYDGDS